MPENPIDIARNRNGLIPARSHYSYKMDGHLRTSNGSLDSSSYSVTGKQIRRQTMSWTFRELQEYDSRMNLQTYSDLSSTNNPKAQLDDRIEESDIMQKNQFVMPVKGNLGNHQIQIPVVTDDHIIQSEEYDTLLSSNTPRKFVYPCLLKILGIAFRSIPAVLLAVMLTLLDAMSYGIIIFPHSDTHIPLTGPQAGISMFFASSILSQIVYTAGGSAFKGAVGSMMIEVVPFLHIICSQIESTMVNESDHAIIATIMTAYTCSTLMTGTVFLLIGVFKLGTVIQFFPRHILIGCIGGIGLFLMLTGLELTTKISPMASIGYFKIIFSLAVFQLWGSCLGLAIMLKIIQKFISHPLLVPIFYAAIPTIFYIFVWSFGISLAELRSQGWLFNFVSSNNEQEPFYIYWTYFDFTIVNWTALAKTIPTQIALTFFGILHVPINVPALSVSTGQEVNLSNEIIGHGISNIVSGLFGTTQNYLVYSNSLLYTRCGGDSVVSGVLLIAVTILLWVRGSFLIHYVPTLVVGSLIFHLGIDLLKESLFDTWSVGMHRLEYLTIVIIVGVMGIVGFTEGIVVGVLLACVFFGVFILLVFMYSRRSIIREKFWGCEMRSIVHRLYRQQEFLDKVGKQTHIVKLQGSIQLIRFMFFGTVNQLDTYIKDLLAIEPQIKFILLDFSLISGIDYSGLETFTKIKRNLLSANTHMLFCGLGKLENDVRLAGIFDNERLNVCSDLLLVHVFECLNDALEWCENQLLSTFYVKSLPIIAAIKKSKENPEFSNSISNAQTPRAKELFLAADSVIAEFPTIETDDKSNHQPFRFLIQALSHSDMIDEHLFNVLSPAFVKLQFMKDEILYYAGSDSLGLYIVEYGELGLSIGDEAKKIVETLLPGTMVGELELFANKPRICTLVCLSDAIVWCLPRDRFESLSISHPALILKFVTKIAVPFDAVRFYNTIHHWAQLS